MIEKFEICDVLDDLVYAIQTGMWPSGLSLSFNKCSGLHGINFVASYEGSHDRVEVYVPSQTLGELTAVGEDVQSHWPEEVLSVLHKAQTNLDYERKTKKRLGCVPSHF